VRLASIFQRAPIKPVRLGLPDEPTDQDVNALLQTFDEMELLLRVVTKHCKKVRSLIDEFTEEGQQTSAELSRLNAVLEMRVRP
jgi:hypothetical protein